MLTGFLRANGVEVTPVDANVEFWDRLLRKSALEDIRERVHKRLARLEGRDRLSHVEQLAYAALWEARGDAEEAPARIEDAVRTLRDPEKLFDPETYDEAVQVVEAALRAISAAHAPLELSFTAYRTPFSMLTPEEIALDARAERNPFHALEVELAQRLRGMSVIGISAVFPGQLQPAFAMAHTLRKQLGDSVHLTLGGPAITQVLLRVRDDAQRLARILGPFDSAICYEGETALLRLCEAVDAGRAPTEIPNVCVRGQLLTPGGTMEDLRTLPAPDFDGLPLDKYLSPRLVLPYDPTRGCYWGVCTFCHYGLTDKGTAPYKERAVDRVLDHLAQLSARFGTRYFYFSQDSVAPKTLSKLADGIVARGLDIRWATDLKPERYMNAERAQMLKKAGAVACALGVESAAPRVLKLIDKGRPIEEVRQVVAHLAQAGVAVEAMCFTDFPTETQKEAMATVRWLEQLHEEIALFILGEFDLTPGSLVAQQPKDFGLAETWRVRGDELGIGLFYEEKRAPKTAADQEKLDGAIERLAEGWLLRRYPWAGSLSTAHTILWYDRFGPDAFRRLRMRRAELEVPERVASARFDVGGVAERAREAEQQIWTTLVREKREVSRAAYKALADALPAARPSPRRWRYGMGQVPTPHGRRPRHQGNAATVRRPSW
jgi:hypothetical protein